MKVWKNKKNKIKIVLQFMEDKLIPDNFFTTTKIKNKIIHNQHKIVCRKSVKQ